MFFSLQADFGNFTKLAGRADQLKGYINNGRSLTDKMDIIYLSDIVDALSQQVKTDKRVSKENMNFKSKILF